MKKLFSLFLACLMCVSLCACSSKKPKLTSDNLVGTWHFTSGDLNKQSNQDTLRFEIYKGGTAREFYESGFFSFTWEISSNDDEVINITSEDFLGFSNTKGFTLEKNEVGNLELHSVDGKVILEKETE